MMQTELKKTISYHINLYKKVFESKLGMDQDDLMNDIMEQVYKGLLTYDPSKRTNKKTYLNKLIGNRFSTLHRRTKIKKYSALEYHADVFSSTGTSVCKDQTETKETSEDLLLRRQELERDREVITEPLQIKIYKELLKGKTVNEMMAQHDLSRVEVIGLINQILARVEERRDNTRKGAL